MVNRTIELLDKETIDQIAAGEVVERPASVVKELVENAIDAGADAVTIETREGGKRLIRVTDNGSGIPAEEIRKAFLRHATSKIRQAEDLTAVTSLGFRGEALSSIASVAQVECVTKTKEALTGIRYMIEGGEETLFEEIGAPDGTTFLVRNLFFNTPVREKFLRTPATESSYVRGFVENLALSHPHISFTCIQDGRTGLVTDGRGDIRSVVYQIYGREIAKNLIPFQTEGPGIRVSGFLGTSIAARGNRAGELFFVNGRPVKDDTLSKAAEDGYHGYLMQHRYPFVLLYLEIDGTLVDVNVHPTKKEVRFSDRESLYRMLCLAIQNTLLAGEHIPDAVPGKEEKSTVGNAPAGSVTRKTIAVPEPFETMRRSDLLSPIPPCQENTESTARRENSENPVPEELFSGNTIIGKNCVYPAAEAAISDIQKGMAPSSPGGGENKYSQEGSNSLLSMPPADRRRGQWNDTMHRPRGDKNAEAFLNVLKEKNDYAASPKQTAEQQSLFEHVPVLSAQARKMHRLIGQVFDTYWLMEYQDSLYIVDQHAAHEKVMFEKLMQQYREKTITSQMLLPAIVVDSGTAGAALLRSRIPVFESLGYEIEEFGGDAFKITAVPANLYRVDPKMLFTDILDQMKETGDIPAESIAERLASMSCKAAVKGNTSLSFAEADALFDELLSLENPYHCPHGRPTIIRMSRTDLDKKFKRIL